jgi:3-hydroxybutyryl-CoA dehydrogenase
MCDLSIAEYLHRELGSETFRPPEVLRRMVSEGKAGKKTGKAFTIGVRRTKTRGRAQSS